MAFNGSKSSLGNQQSPGSSKFRFLVFALVIVIGLLMYYCWTLSLEATELQERISKYAKANRDLRSENTGLQTTLATYKQRIDQTLKESAQKVNELQSTLSDKTLKLESYSRQLEEKAKIAERDIEKLNSDLQTSSREAVEFKKQADEAKEACASVAREKQLKVLQVVQSVAGDETILKIKEQGIDISGLKLSEPQKPGQQQQIQQPPRQTEQQAQQQQTQLPGQQAQQQQGQQQQAQQPGQQAQQQQQAQPQSGQQAQQQQGQQQQAQQPGQQSHQQQQGQQPRQLNQQSVQEKQSVDKSQDVTGQSNIKSGESTKQPGQDEPNKTTKINNDIAQSTKKPEVEQSRVGQISQQAASEKEKERNNKNDDDDDDYEGDVESHKNDPAKLGKKLDTEQVSTGVRAPTGNNQIKAPRGNGQGAEEIPKNRGRSS